MPKVGFNKLGYVSVAPEGLAHVQGWRRSRAVCVLSGGLRRP